MPKSSEIEGLIARLEAATGPSLELDGRVWCAANGYEFVQWDGAGCVYRNPAAEPQDRGIKHAPAWVVRPYTASVDAALALVERVLPGCLVSISRGPNHAKRRRGSDRAPIPWDAYIANNDRIGEPSHAFALTEGSTAPLAILLALLYALSAKAAP